MNRASVRHYRAGRQQRTRRLIHKRHKLIGKSWHGTTDANPADIRAAADSIHPAALPNVALHHRPPASQLHDARWRAVFLRELRLLVISPAVASLVHRGAEKPRGT